MNRCLICFGPVSDDLPHYYFIPIDESKQTEHFCSEKCYNRFLDERRADDTVAFLGGKLNP